MTVLGARSVLNETATKEHSLFKAFVANGFVFCFPSAQGSHVAVVCH